MSATVSVECLSAKQIVKLRGAAAEAAQKAYAPYSRFYVGAALLLETGETVTGCNVENVSFRLTCCAEQTAVTRAVAEHGPGIRIAAVAVANLDATVACQPCGACRQTLAEFAGGDCRVFYPGEGGGERECTLGELLPASFDVAKLRAASATTAASPTTAASAGSAAGTAGGAGDDCLPADGAL